MSLRCGIARAVGALCTGLLKNVLHRPAANFPGKAALLVDPRLIADLRGRVRQGSVVVVGTNGKTTVTNMLACALEAAGKTVACNRTGANLDSGVASALLQAGSADWGVFESDELWLARVLPQLQADYVVLLNLFRDQLDRAGEIERVQVAITQALANSPGTTLVYNADDPLCQGIAARCANACIPFGIEGDLGFPPNTVSDSGMCQQCDALLEYRWRQYGQLGSYRCPQCGFQRADPAYALRDVSIQQERAAFTLCRGPRAERVEVPFPEPYMLYNVLAVLAAADLCGVPVAAARKAVCTFDPHNGRLQRYALDGRTFLLNLAKNPTGMNQSLRVVCADAGPKAVAVFINDKEADGHDVSWLWDVDFQELAGAGDTAVFAGGMRRNDLQVRLKYAGVHARLVGDAREFLAQAAGMPPAANHYLLANYTALPGVKAVLDGATSLPAPAAGEPAGGREAAAGPTAAGGKLVLVHLYPDVLNLYGDGGNVAVLAARARWRGLEVEVVRVACGQEMDLARADIVFLGGGPDREQRLAARALALQAGALRDYVEDDGVLLAICGGYQLLGREWVLGDEVLPGLAILDVETGRAPGGSRNRLVGNVVLQSPLAAHPVVGYENHAGRTYLGRGCLPFGTVLGGCGKGNNGEDGADGVRYRNVVGTYLHGPLLAKNPQVADWLLARALERRAAKEGRCAPVLEPLDDAAELAANAFMCAKLHAR